MPRKLIEVALPLDAINVASAREKSIRHGHPSTLHLWWARRPLAAARAVLFSSIVDDPGDPEYRWPAVLDSGPWDGLERIARGKKLMPAALEAAAAPRDHSEEEIDAERGRLHDLIATLVTWESTTDEHVLGQARAEIMRATDGNPPPVLDPFAGGGSIPLEAQRLGLEAHASDLNPVAVLINKALIEIPPRFTGQPPVNPEARAGTGQGMSWKGATGLAADVRYYGKWMRDEAEERIGHLYPKVKLSTAQGGGEATVIAWLWARTVTCPNPACGAQMPLISSFWLSKKQGSQTWIVPHVDQQAKSVRFEVASGPGGPIAPPKLGRGAKFKCLVCGEAAQEGHIKREGVAKRMGAQLMAVVAEGARGRLYVEPHATQEQIDVTGHAMWKPEALMPQNPRWFSPPAYGLTTFGDLFTDRQLVALTTFSDLVGQARKSVLADAIAAGLVDDGAGIAAGGTGAGAYADAVATYLGCSVSKALSRNCSLAYWETGMNRLAGAFGRQAIPMSWDFAETNPLAGAGGDIKGTAISVAEVLDKFDGKVLPGMAEQADASTLEVQSNLLISTDPPYYDNIGYADLSDFFYIWLHRSLNDIHPQLFRTVLVPKSEELIATPHRFGGNRKQADEFFENGLRQVFRHSRIAQNANFPLSMFYAFKQSESDTNDSSGKVSASTGWETMLEGLVQSGFAVTATWPMRTELTSALKRNISALASSIVLACRLRPDSAPNSTRREFIRELRRELPGALKTMQAASIAPVDLAQAAIGPGMAIYSRYSGVLEPTGDRLPVRTALQLINQVLDEVLAEQDSEHDRDTGWAIAWFEQNGMTEAAYGQAETLATARNVSVSGLVEAGILRSSRGKVKLLARDELLADWDPATEKRLTDWEIAQYLIRELDAHGNMGAARLKRRIGGRADLAKDLAYRLYTICERKGWAQEAIAYNGLVVAWPEIVRLAADLTPVDYQTTLTMG